MATYAEAPFLAHYRPTGEAFPAEATLLAGTYRIPTRVQSALRAAAGNRDHSGPCPHLLAPPGRDWQTAQRFAHAVTRGARLCDLAAPPGARPLYGVNPASPFAAGYTTSCSVTDLP